MTDLEYVSDVRRAQVLLDPLRLRILELAREPASATDIAGRLRMPRQKVNYHVRALARARFLRRAGQRRKRNMIERRFQATARAYVLGSEVMGPAQIDPRHVADKLSAAYLVALAASASADVGRLVRAAEAQGKRLATLSLAAQLRFQSAEERGRFAAALEAAILDVIARHASPATLADGGPGPGRPYRLVVGCYPTPPDDDEKGEDR